MNILPKILKKTNLITATLAVLALSSCNMLSFMDSPSGDAQLKDAARSCLDKGDYDCALEYYQKLSNAAIDVKISETSLTQLAKFNIFKMSDLFTSLGSGTGDSASFTFLAETMASRSVTTSDDRTTIQQAFSDNALIADPTIKAYMQFITALVMTNHLLASAVGADGILTASDIVQNPSQCLSMGCPSAGCNKPSGTVVDDTLGSDVTDLATSTNWNTAPSIQKIIQAASAANDASATLFGGGTGGGLGSIFGEIISNAPPGSTDCIKRYAVLSALFSVN